MTTHTHTSPGSADTLTRLPLAFLVASLTNPRKHFDAAKMAELTDSIRQHGIFQPILVRPLPASRTDVPDTVTHEIIAGERRYRAATAALLMDVPVVIRSMDDAEVIALQLIENLQRADLTALEEAEGFKAAILAGINANEMAERIGKSRSYIYSRIKLTELPEPAKAAINESKLDPSIGLLIARLPLPSMQEEALRTILAGKGTGNGEPLSVRAAKAYLQSSFMRSFKGATWLLYDALLIPAAGACDACPKRTSVNRDLYPDISADVCTDPTCFNAKAKTFADRGPLEKPEAATAEEAPADSQPQNELDERYNQAVDIVVGEQKVSISQLQRALMIGYYRASTLIDEMEKRGVVSIPDKEGHRRVLFTRPAEESGASSNFAFVTGEPEFGMGSDTRRFAAFTDTSEGNSEPQPDHNTNQLNNPKNTPHQPDTAPTILVRSGIYFDFSNPLPAQVRIEDIAHALANLCRFNGHTKHFYSVAQHCIEASYIVPPAYALQALLHDAAEAYLGDVTRPLKARLPDYKVFERRVEDAIAQSLSIPTGHMHAEVIKADLTMLATETRDLMPEHSDTWPCLNGITPLEKTLIPLSQQVAKAAYLRRFTELTAAASPATKAPPEGEETAQEGQPKNRWPFPRGDRPDRPAVQPDKTKQEAAHAAKKADEKAAPAKAGAKNSSRAAAGGKKGRAE
jgi:ParB/RepB/Spo0J family partition protein